MLASVRRLSSALLLVTWLSGLLIPAVTLHAEIDADCGDLAWQSDHSRTGFEDVRPDVGHGHCDLCHLQRAMGGVLLVAAAGPWSTGRPGFTSALREAHFASTAFRALPPRAPPASPSVAL